jgi:hypothetical protein
MSDLEEALAAARAARAQAHEKLTAAEATKADAVAAVATATAIMAARQQDHDGARTLTALEHARAALDQAANVYTLAVRDAQDAATAHAAAVAEHQQAQAVVAVAATAITDQKAAAIAAEIVGTKARLDALGLELRDWVADDLHTPINSAGRVEPANIQRALELTAPPAFDIHRPVHVMRRSLSAGSALAQRRAELMGDGEPPRAA